MALVLWWVFVLCMPASVQSQTNSTQTIINTAQVLGVTPGGTTLQGSDDAVTDVPLLSHLQLDITADSTYAQPGDLRTFTHVLFNRGNFQETVRLEVLDTRGWPLQLRSSKAIASSSEGLEPSLTRPPSSRVASDELRHVRAAARQSPMRLNAPILFLGRLAPGDSVEISIDVTVPPTALLGAFDDITLVAQSLRVPAETAQVIDRVIVADPRLDPMLLTVTPEGTARPGEFLSYQLQFGNPDAAVALLNVQFTDALDAGLTYINATNGTVADTAVPGRSVDVVRNWNPLTRQITWNVASLPPGFRGSLEVQAQIGAGVAEGTRIPNEFVADGSNLVQSTSNRVETAVLSQVLLLTSASAVQDILPGDPVLYMMTLTNVSQSLDVSNATVSFVLPAGFRYLDHGSAVQGKALVGAPSEGRTATFDVALLAAGETRNWTLAAAASDRVGKGSHDAHSNAYGVVMGDVPVSVQQAATVRVLRNFDQYGVVMGRVYIDENENRQSGLQEGLPNVRLLLDDGTQVWTDARGRYSLEGIRPGVRVLRIDTSDLPETLEFDRDGRLAAGNDWTRFVDVQPGELRNVDFRAVRKKDTSIRKFQIALQRQTWEFYEFSLFEAGQDKLKPEAARMLARLAADTGPAVADSLRLYVGEPQSRQAWAMGVPRKTTNTAIVVQSRLLVGSNPVEDTTPVLPAPFNTEHSGTGVDAASQLSENLAQARQTKLQEALTGIKAVEDTAPETPEETLEQRARTSSPDPAILYPTEGSTSRGDRTRVTVKYPRGKTATVRINGKAVSTSLVGRHIESPRNGVVMQEYIGVPLAAGRNEVTLEVCDAAGTCLTQRVMVLLPGEPQQLILRTEPTAADGRTEPMVHVVLLDAWDHPVSHMRFVTLEAEGGILGADEDPRRPGHQVRLQNGFAKVYLPPATRAEERRLLARFGNLETQQLVRLVPAPSDWMITGVGEVTLAARPRNQPLTSDEASHGADARAGIFARGRVGQQSELTLGLDTERQREELFAERERQRLYPVLGDESFQGSAAPTRWPLFARIDVPEGHAQIGDFRAGWNHVELARFDRSLTGFDGTWTPEEGGASVQGFVASARQRARLDQFRGIGTSGPFTVQHRPLLVHSERLSIETRDRIHTERVLLERPLVREVDYTVDYANGSILLKEALPGADTGFNPNYLVVRYESVEEGEERPVFGMHGTARLGHHLQAGVTAVHEQTAWGSQTLLGTHGDWSPRSDMRFDYEFAHSAGLERDQAMRVSWTGRTGPAEQTRLYYRQVGAHFRNEGRSGGQDLGTRKYGLEANMQAGSRGRVEFQSWVQEDLIRSSDTWSVGADYMQDRHTWQFSVGHRLVGRRDTMQQTVSNVASLSTRRRLGSRLGVEAGAQKAMGGSVESHPSRVHVGADARLSSRITLRGRQEWDGSNRGRRATLLGLESSLGRNTSMTSRIENVRNPFADRLAAWVGVRTRVPLSPTWSLNGSAEQGRVFTADESRNTAIAGGVQWQNAARLWSLQYEGRTATGIQEHALRTSASLRLGTAWTLVGREHWRRIYATLGTRDTHDVLLAGVYRPVEQGRSQWLGSVRAVVDPNPWLSPGVSLSRTVGSLEGSWQLSRRYSWVGGALHRFAGTSVGATSVQTQTSLTHSRLIYDIGGGFDLSVGVRHRWRNHSASDWSWGGELGYLVLRDVWIVGGYNAVGFADIDLPTHVNAGQAGYLSFRFKFDERLLISSP